MLTRLALSPSDMETHALFRQHVAWVMHQVIDACTGRPGEPVPPAFAAAVAHEMGRVEALLKVSFVVTHVACRRRMQHTRASGTQPAVRVSSESAVLASVLRTTVVNPSPLVKMQA